MVGVFLCPRMIWMWVHWGIMFGSLGITVGPVVGLWKLFGFGGRGCHTRVEPITIISGTMITVIENNLK